MGLRKMLGLALGGLLAVSAATVTFVTAEAAWGWLVALIAVGVALVVAPLLLAGVRLPEEDAWRPGAGARRWTRFVAGCSTLVLVMLAATARVSPCDALRGMPTRHPGLGAVSRLLARLGDAMAPAQKPSVASTTATTAAPSAAPTTSAASVANAPRFSAGDTSYRESACTPLADISDVAKAYTEAGFRTALETVATRRYPIGVTFIRTQNDAQLGAWFPAGRSTFAQAMAGFDTAVHEGSHVWQAVRFDGKTQTFRVRDDLDVVVKWVSTFPRSELLDEHPDKSADKYAATYLQGEPGKQGFASVLDELNGYDHSLAARWCTRDTVPAGTRVSARDGVLTFMFYLGEYLRVARARHPKDYAALLDDPGIVKMVVTLWDRSEFWLRLAAGEHSLGVDDDRIAPWAYDPARLDEVGRVRSALKR